MNLDALGIQDFANIILGNNIEIEGIVLTSEICLIQQENLEASYVEEKKFNFTKNNKILILTRHTLKVAESNDINNALITIELEEILGILVGNMSSEIIIRIENKQDMYFTCDVIYKLPILSAVIKEYYELLNFKIKVWFIDEPDLRRFAKTRRMVNLKIEFDMDAEIEEIHDYFSLYKKLKEEFNFDGYFENEVKLLFCYEKKWELHFSQGLKDLKPMILLENRTYRKLFLSEEALESDTRPYFIQAINCDNIKEAFKFEEIITEKATIYNKHNPFLLNFNCFLKQDNHYYLIFEGIKGGSLLSFLNKSKCFKEEEVKFLIGCILVALYDLHKNQLLFHWV